MNVLNAGKNSYFNRYLLDLPCGLCLIDGGYKWEYDDFIEKLNKLGRKKEEIKFVIITHAHSDHVGFLKRLIETVQPTVIYHPGQKARLEAGKNDLDTYISTFIALIGSKITATFVDKYQCFPAVKCDKFIPYYNNPLADYGVEFIALAGHTDADLAVKFGSGLYCGDLFMNCTPALHKFPLWVKNKFVLVSSWEEILKHKEIAVVYPSHGKPFNLAETKKDLEYWRDKGVFKLFKSKTNQL